MTTTAGLRLRAPANRLDRRAITWWRLSSLIDVILLLTLLSATWWWWTDARDWIAPIWIAVLVLGVGRVIVMPLVRYHVHRWETTDESVYASSGWVLRQWRIAPISRIQTVDTTRGPIQQALGLSTLVVTTASAVGPIKIEGMTVETAMDVAAELSRLASLDEGDAT